MLPRTPRQKQILDYIVRYSTQRGHVPSYTQIARFIGVKSRATVAKHIAALEKRGLLERRDEEGSFALAVVVSDMPSDALCEIPMHGRIAAGTPIEAFQDTEMIAVPRFLLGRVRPERRTSNRWCRCREGFGP